MMLMSRPGYMEEARPIPSTTKLERNTPWITTPTRLRSFTSRGTSSISSRNAPVTDARQKSSSRGSVRLSTSAV